ncbi:hypothetical protein ACIBF6_38010 [Streptosporangium amethystogenes]|uniref:hypothetical protein n=1 Tax=Streptosporangium amethystogenes TaxID=2002 RepID=UPI0037B66786
MIAIIPPDPLERIPMSTMSALARLASTAALTMALALAGSLVQAPAAQAASQAPAAQAASQALTVQAASQALTVQALPCSGKRIGRIQITARNGSAEMKGAFLHVYRNGSRVCAFTNTSLEAERYAKFMSVSIWVCGRTVGECRDYQDHLDGGGYHYRANTEQHVNRGFYRTNGATLIAGGQCIRAWGGVSFTGSRNRLFAGEANSAISCQG